MMIKWTDDTRVNSISSCWAADIECLYLVQAEESKHPVNKQCRSMGKKLLILGWKSEMQMYGVIRRWKSVRITTYKSPVKFLLFFFLTLSAWIKDQLLCLRDAYGNEECTFSPRVNEVSHALKCKIKRSLLLTPRSDWQLCTKCVRLSRTPLTRGAPETFFVRDFMEQPGWIYSSTWPVDREALDSFIRISN